LFTLQESDELVWQTAEKIMASEHGVRSRFLSKTMFNTNKDCGPVQLPKILLYVEQSVLAVRR
jgi:hypothetical protein